MKRCIKCLVTDAVPDISLSADGICNLSATAHNWGRRLRRKEGRRAYEADFSKNPGGVQRTGEYDCLFR